MSNEKETKVMCPVCGTEFAIGEHEHQVKNAIAIGKDSGLGEVYLPVSKRGNALRAAGIDPTKYFSIALPTGGEQLMRMDGERAVPVTDDDPVLQAIARQGTVPNRSLFRRWVMSQVFHWLIFDEQHGAGAWLRYHGYEYQWKMLEEELRVQAKLYGRDVENFTARNRWFNKDVAVSMANDYIMQMRKDAEGRPKHSCKGVPYIKFNRTNIFVSDIGQKLVHPMLSKKAAILDAKTPSDLYRAVRAFRLAMYCGYKCYNQCREWKDAYKGMGAYATMQNLLRFHGCEWPKDNDFYSRSRSGLAALEDAANCYVNEGWRMFGLMKRTLVENGIDIKAKMREWARKG